MKQFLIKLFGKEWYCRSFHTRYGIEKNKSYCPKCKLTMDRRLSDGDTGPR